MWCCEYRSVFSGEEHYSRDREFSEWFSVRSIIQPLCKTCGNKGLYAYSMGILNKTWTLYARALWNTLFSMLDCALEAESESIAVVIGLG